MEYKHSIGLERRTFFVTQVDNNLYLKFILRTLLRLGVWDAHQI